MIKMERRFLFILLIVFVGLMMLSIFAVAQMAKARTITVDDDGNANYTKIQDAINTANPGDTVYVYNGTYYERILVDKTIHLTGENQNTTVIDGNDTGPVVSIWANYVNFSGFTVRDGGNSSSSSYLIQLSGRNINMKYNTIINFSCGIFVYLGGQNIIEFNTIINWRGDGTCGIDVHCSDNNTVISNSLMGVGVWLPSEMRAVENNTIDGKPLYYIKNIDSRKNPTVLECAGQIILHNSSGFIIRDNIINNANILVWNSNYNVVERNILTNGSSVQLYESSNNMIIHNMMYNVTNGIIARSNSNNNTISSNTILFSKKTQGCVTLSTGICLDYSSNNLIISNTVCNVSDDCMISYGVCLSGLSFYPCSSNVITENKLLNNSYGILLTSSSNNVITSNEIRNSSIAAIYLRGGVLTYRGPPDSSDWHKILQTSSNNTIASNAIVDNSGGVRINCSFDNVVKYNNIYGNKKYGLYIDYGVGNNATNNWWGSASGPYNVTLNPTGGGDNIIGDIDFSRWKTSLVTNHMPTITSIKTNLSVVPFNWQVKINTTAVDADNDTLSYHYMSSDGSIIAVDSLAIWTAPQIVGNYIITVTVTDGNLTAISNVTIVVVNQTQIPNQTGNNQTTSDNKKEKGFIPFASLNIVIFTILILAILVDFIRRRKQIKPPRLFGPKHFPTPHFSTLLNIP